MYAPFVAVIIIYSSICVPCKLFKYGAWPVRGKREAPCVLFFLIFFDQQGQQAKEVRERRISNIVALSITHNPYYRYIFSESSKS